jgi:hypothetical protein
MLDNANREFGCHLFRDQFFQSGAYPRMEGWIVFVDTATNGCTKRERDRKTQLVNGRIQLV